MDNEKKPSHSNSGITKVKGMIILLTIVTILISTLVGITVSRYEDTNKIKETLELGDVYLTSGRSEDAKKTFNEAILLNTKNKDTYVKIKNLYIKANRLDDALYFLKLALFNKAKDSEFKKSIDEIKKSFEITNIELITNENDSFIPPKKVPMKINNEEVNVDVKWAGTRIDTSKSKNITIEGTSEEYERKVLLTVRVLPKILSIKNINASIIQGQEYKLPSKIQATFINGATNDVVVSWEPASLVNNTVGTQSFLGTVAKYEKKVLLTLTVNPKAIIKTVFSGYIQKVYEDGG
ncbi:MAG: Ig-like domain-containing protein, partial [Clostridiaceae bacterium]|nr:Ig-like domain-containing protein [Clostridiaceae bacterium]